MKQTSTQNLYNFWNTLRNGRIAPYRSEIDPRKIAPYLDSTFILELIGEDKIRFRLAGTRLCDAYGMELRGMSAFCLWQGECRDKMKELMMNVVNTPSVGVVSCTVETQAGLLQDAEFLFMPLRSDFGEIDRILGCVFYSSSDNKRLQQITPMQHWVDKTELLPIDIKVIDNSSRHSTSFLNRRRRIDGSEKVAYNRQGTGNFPPLTTIQGGIKGFKRPDSNADGSSSTPRGHLRLVKSDAS
jgi:hypothetical protein